MNRPPLTTYLIGNPLVASTAVIAFGISLYRWWHGQFSGGATFVIFILTCSAMQASQRLNDYRNWKRSWDALDGASRAPAKRRPVLKALLLAGLILLAVGVLSQYPQTPATQTALGGLVIALLVLLAYGLFHLLCSAIRRIRRRRSTPKPHPVAICVTQPLLALPTLTRAYECLPDHCAELLRQSNSKLQ